MTRRRQSFLHGAAILAAGACVVKVIGALYKIPLGNLLGPVGMSDFSVAYNIYALLFVISTSGVPTALSKLISQKLAQGRYDECLAVKRVAEIVFGAIGLSGFLFMFFGADFLSKIMGSPSAAAAIRAAAPAVMFVSISAVNRGFFQGMSDMYPTAGSEIIEALGKLFVGLFLALYLRKSGRPADMVAAGAVFGVSAGAFLSSAFFMVKRSKEKSTVKRIRIDGIETIKKLFALAAPITLGASVISLTNVIDSALVMNLLQRKGMSLSLAKWNFGSYNYASTIFNLPSVIVTTLSSALVPALSENYEKKDLFTLEKTVRAGMKVSMLLSACAGFGMAALSNELCSILFGHGADDACIRLSAKLLLPLAAAVPFVALSTVTNAVHQSFGNVTIPVYSLLAGAIVKIVSNYFLLCKMNIGILGASVSTLLCYLTIAILNIYKLKKYSFLELRTVEIFAKPLLVGYAVFLAANYVKTILLERFGIFLATFLSVAAGLCACAVVSVLVGTVTKEEKKLVFKKKDI